MMDQSTRKNLEQLELALVRDAEASGEGPKTMRKSRFRSEMERASFIMAYGQSTYDALED